MGLSFIDRTLKTSGLILLVFLPFGLYYFGVFPALAVLSGGIWGMLNLMFISQLVLSTIRSGDISKSKAIRWLIIKFPLLYLAGYFLLNISQFTPWQILLGSSVVFVVMLLKALARVMLGLDDHKENSGAQQAEKVQEAR